MQKEKLLPAGYCGNVRHAVGAKSDNIVSFLGVIANYQQINEILKNIHLPGYQLAFNELRFSCSFFPIRQKAQNYVQRCIKVFFSDDQIRAMKDSVFRTYTTNPNWYCTTLNISLALDLDLTQHYDYINKLKACIAYQKPKAPPMVYRGLYMSALELFFYWQKDIFYIPSFTSSSTDRKKAFDGNVLIEIDTSRFNDFTTLIQNGQSGYDESECLISAYNIYQFYSLTLENDKVILRLMLLPYEDYNDKYKHEIKNCVHDTPECVIKGAQEESRVRTVEPQTLFDQYNGLRKCYFELQCKSNTRRANEKNNIINYK